MDGIITLTTDFGTADAYVAAMKGVILTINPRATIVDICHSIKPQNIFEGAFIISTVHKYFPKGTIHVVVVDPGVGSPRKALILKTHAALFLAPDNGVLSYIVAEVSANPVYESKSINLKLKSQKLGDEVTAVNITNPKYWQKPVSTTFHGRDVFAPIAAYLSLGVPVNKFGKRITRLHVFPIPYPYQDSYGNIIGLILHIDNFGNLITNIKSTDLKTQQVNIFLGTYCIRGISSFYAQGKGLMALIGSNGYLEISFAEGNAAAVLNARVGDTVTVSPDTTP